MSDDGETALKKNYAVPSAKCPLCKAKSDLAAIVDSDDRPKAGDFAVCIACGAVNVYIVDLQLRAVTQTDLEDADQGTLQRVTQLQRIIRHMRSN